MESNSQEKIHASVEWMSAMYDKMNNELFDGALGACNFDVFTTGRGSQGRVLGWFKIKGSGVKVERTSRRMFVRTRFGKEYIDANNFVNYCKPQIELNGNYTATEEGFLATLVHEMCHYYTYMRGICPRQGHGTEFYAIGRVVSAKSNGRFTIRRLATAEEMEEWELNPEMQAKKDKRIANKKSKLNAIFFFFQNGTVELSTTSNQNVIRDIVNSASNRLSHPTRSRCLQIIQSNDPELIEMLFNEGYRKDFRTYRYWNVESKPWINTLTSYDYKELFKAEPLNMESKERKKIVEDVINKFLKEEFGIGAEDDVISIDPNMNLGLESPLETV